MALLDAGKEEKQEETTPDGHSPLFCGGVLRISQGAPLSSTTGGVLAELPVGRCCSRSSPNDDAPPVSNEHCLFIGTSSFPLDELSDGPVPAK